MPQSRLERFVDWMDRDDARRDAVLAAKSSWWHFAKFLIGACFAVRVSHEIYTGAKSGVIFYVFATLLFVGGVYFMFEAGRTLLQRLSGRSA